MPRSNSTHPRSTGVYGLVAQFQGGVPGTLRRQTRPLRHLLYLIIIFGPAVFAPKPTRVRLSVSEQHPLSRHARVKIQEAWVPRSVPDFQHPSAAPHMETIWEGGV